MASINDIIILENARQLPSDMINELTSISFFNACMQEGDLHIHMIEVDMYLTKIEDLFDEYAPFQATNLFKRTEEQISFSRNLTLLVEWMDQLVTKQSEIEESKEAYHLWVDVLIAQLRKESYQFPRGDEFYFMLIHFHNILNDPNKSESLKDICKHAQAIVMKQQAPYDVIVGKINRLLEWKEEHK